MQHSALFGWGGKLSQLLIPFTEKNSMKFLGKDPGRRQVCLEVGVHKDPQARDSQAREKDMKVFLSG